MTRQYAQFPEECGSCGGLGRGELSYEFQGESFHWNRDFWCDACRLSACEHGRGVAPDSLRGPLVDADGVFTARYARGQAVRKAQAMRVFRKVFAVDIEEAARAADALGDGGWRGTRVEVTAVARLLGAIGVEVEERRTPEG